MRPSTTSRHQQNLHCGLQVVRMQRAEQRWTLWGRSSTHDDGDVAEEQELGSFDAVILCDALTARPGPQCSCWRSAQDKVLAR
jgi:hypothetical protein